MRSDFFCFRLFYPANELLAAFPGIVILDGGIIHRLKGCDLVVFAIAGYETVHLNVCKTGLALSVGILYLNYNVRVKVNCISGSGGGVYNIINVIYNDGSRANTCVNVLITVPNNLVVILNSKLYVLKNIEISGTAATFKSECGGGLYTICFKTNDINLTVSEYPTALCVNNDLNAVACAGKCKLKLS